MSTALRACMTSPRVPSLRAAGVEPVDLGAGLMEQALVAQPGDVEVVGQQDRGRRSGTPRLRDADRSCAGSSDRVGNG